MSERGEDRVALVTGANRGIGREVARQLAQRGYEVLLSARDEVKAAEAAAEIAASTGARVRGVALDVADPASIASAVAQVQAEPGRLDVLVNNAGVGLDFGVSGTEPDFAVMQADARDELLRRLPPHRGAAGAAARERASADRERVERHGRGERDGRLVARLPSVQGGAQRDDAHPLHGAEAGGLPRQLRLPGLREDGHGWPHGGAASRWRTARQGWCGWRRSPTTVPRAASSGMARRSPFEAVAGARLARRRSSWRRAPA